MMFRNARILLRTAVVGALATFAFSQAASAQQDAKESEEMVLVAGTVDCHFPVRPTETTICSTPVLAAMDLQMITLYNILNALVKPEVGIELATGQQVFIKEREVCASDIDCIGKVTATRIGELDNVLKDIASRGPY